MFRRSVRIEQTSAIDLNKFLINAKLFEGECKELWLW